MKPNFSLSFKGNQKVFTAIGPYSVLGELMSNPKTVGSVSSVMMKMSKLVISELVHAAKA
jgi:hypothetical protein